MKRFGVVGFGFMGNMHARCYRGTTGAQLAAICDPDQDKLTAENAGGNIPGTETPLYLHGVGLYTDFDRMLKEAKLDAVSITVPSFMHADFTVKALERGLHVLCEKPMALDESQCEQMITAAEKSGRILQIGHCIRFWPEYAMAKQIVDSGKYGRVKVASLSRLTFRPDWSWQGWLMNRTKSGGVVLDLHIHDADYIQYLFGMPEAVYSRAAGGQRGDFDHIATQYIYDDRTVISAQGGWMMTGGFGFRMSFDMVLERATIEYDSTRDPVFRICPADSEAFTPKVGDGDGYTRQIEHFVKAVNGQKVPQITTPQQSLNSIKLVLAERQSAQTGKEVKVR